jgi:hypothetical protein
MPEFVNQPQDRVIRVTYDGRTREVEVGGNDRVEDIARLYNLDTRQYRFYDQNDGALDLGAFVRDVEGIRIIQNPKGA